MKSSSFLLSKLRKKKADIKKKDVKEIEECIFSSMVKFDVMNHLKKNMKDFFCVEDLASLFDIRDKESFVSWLESNPRVELFEKRVRFYPEHGVRNKTDLCNLFEDNVAPGSDVESITRKVTEEMYPSSRSDLKELIQLGKVVDVNGTLFTPLNGKGGSPFLKSLYRSVPLPDSITTRKYLVEHNIRKEYVSSAKKETASNIKGKCKTTRSIHDRKRIMKTNTHLF